MRHLDAATIVAVRDGEPVDGGTRAHLDECATCSAALSAAHTRREAIARTLTALDRPIESTAAKAGVRARMRPAGSAWPPKWGGRHLGRAAAILLVTAGAAAALPGSPLRTLLSPTASTPSEPSIVAAPAEAMAETATVDAPPTRITVAVPDGFAHIIVRGAAPGSEISVTWTHQPTVSLSAAPGSRFTYASGRVEVDASRGAVLAEFPRDATRISLEVDGYLFLTGSSEALEILGPAIERTNESIRFKVAER